MSSDGGDDPRSQLYQRFGLKAPPRRRPAGAAADAVAAGGGSAGAPPAPEPPEPPPIDESWLDAMDQALRNEPDATLARARTYLNGDIKDERDLRILMANVRAALKRPDVANDWLAEKLSASLGPTALPAEFQQTFDGWDDRIAIDPGDCRMEEQRDALGWVFNVGWLLVKWKRGWDKASFVWHDSAQSEFRYSLKIGADRTSSLSLFADWGTGLYHSQYIANRLRDRASDYAIHLGDVYYAGKQAEFAGNFIPGIDRLIDKGKQVFMMNGNHEMLSGGHNYFNYIAAKKARGQQQEGSYFSLESERFFVVGVDTSYHDDGRLEESRLQSWLRARLEDGRKRGAVNVLLSGNEPYEVGKPGLGKLLTDDLAGIVSEGLVDVWFWGNTHYCALFEPSGGTPFVGSCIGHGGFPYRRYGDVDKPGSPTAVRFLETAARFPAWTGVRQDRGNNGFVQMTLDHTSGTIRLEYVDWMNQLRHSAFIKKDGRRAVFFTPEQP
jgi:hypothetical protein